MFGLNRTPFALPRFLQQSLTFPEISFMRWASKKAAGGGNKNPKQAPGNRKGVKYLEGHRVHPEDIIVHKQSKLWFHPGLNVRLAGRLNMVARKTGTVRYTCETPNLSWENRIVQKHYQSRIMPTFKKYIHVIPDPQHNRFRFVESV